MNYRVLHLLLEFGNDYLVQGMPTPKQHKPHELTGNWKPDRECHIQPDFLQRFIIALAWRA